ncbi:recombinase family protein [Tautonia marina]|uniref:recombinase family protein n=1 Tax=Tautonia marina TaxID=2653855 RepID=UPI00191BD647
MAAEAYFNLAPKLAELRAEGLSLRQIAGWLNGEGYTTRRDMPWNQVQVKRVLGRDILYQINTYLNVKRNSKLLKFTMVDPLPF